MVTEKGDGRHLFRLYVAGNAPNSLRARANLERLAQRYLAGLYEIEIVDLMQEPERSFADGVLVSPTLVRLEPGPMVRIVGDLSRTGQVLSALEIAGDAIDLEPPNG